MQSSPYTALYFRRQLLLLASLRLRGHFDHAHYLENMLTSCLYSINNRLSAMITKPIRLKPHYLLVVQKPRNIVVLIEVSHQEIHRHAVSLTMNISYISFHTVSLCFILSGQTQIHQGQLDQRTYGNYPVFGLAIYSRTSVRSYTVSATNLIVLYNIIPLLLIVRLCFGTNTTMSD